MIWFIIGLLVLTYLGLAIIIVGARSDPYRHDD